MAIQAISRIASTGSSQFAMNSQPVSAGKSAEGGGSAASSGASNTSSTDSTDSYDKMDLNKDGTVTASERALYLKMHPNEMELEDYTQNYSSQGQITEMTGGSTSLLDLAA
ncbi:MAG: hypothetical protein GYA15_14390 [Leptolinea sp.]|jgi:hypothetical protein|nr:hypothetical protein [Leptolinea sp.]